MNERVWDKFLTEQDRAHLAMKGHKSFGFGSKPALLLIDLYRWVFGDKPEPLLEAIKTWPLSCGLAAWDALPHIRTILEKARQAGIPVIHVTGLEKESGVKEWAPSSRRAEKQNILSPEALDRQRRCFDIVDEVKPLPGEVVIRKTSPSAFWGTPLIGHLNFLDVDTIITCGESTSGCVRASVVDGCTFRFRMVVVEEGVFDRSQASHAINLFDMNQKYADVLPLAEVIGYLDEWQSKKTPPAKVL